MNYSETVQYLYDRLPVFHLKGASAYKPGLHNTIQLMEVLNQPHKKFKSIHIAGTNGKGSVSHILAAILQSAGYKVGLYTSPHLVDFGERIRINGEKINPEYVIQFVENQKDNIEKIQPSFFETTMSMAFKYFADNEVDIAVIETGLGGRLDSTNIIQPILSVITNIGLDHTEFLGEELSLIAFEKAGIIKPNSPVVVGEMLAETRDVFLNRAEEVGTILYTTDDIVLENIEIQPDALKFEYQNEKLVSDLPGIYQLKNIATVLKSIEILNKLNFNVGVNEISCGLQNVKGLTGLRGRWEVLKQNPFIVADTGHNTHGILQVNNHLKSIQFKKLHIVIGMVNDKDATSVLNLLPENAIYYFCKANTDRARKPTELQEIGNILHLISTIYETVNDAVSSAMYNAESDDLILITGSNFVVGEGIAYFDRMQ